MAKRVRKAFLVDVGGTNTRVAKLDGRGELQEPVHFASKELPSLEEALAGIYDGEKVAVLALAGPVLGGRTKLTNLSFAVDAAGLGEALGLERVVVTNDLIAHGVGLLGAAGELRALEPRRRLPSLDHGPVAVIAAGTGVGEAVFERQDGALLPRPTEGGHAPAALDVDDEEAVDYVRFVAGRRGAQPSCEDILAGHGIGLLYDYFCEVRGVRELAKTRARIAAAADRNVAIVEAGRSGESKAAARSVALYVRLLAVETRSVVLKHLAFGGAVLAGGLAASLKKELVAHDFRKHFVGGGPFAARLAEVPLGLAKGSDTALLGAAMLARGEPAVRGGQFGLFVWSRGR